MGKINKFSNIYDKNGALLRKAIIKDYTVEELEELVDKIAEEKDENGRVKDPQALNNANQILIQLYQSPKNKAKLLEKLQKTMNAIKPTTDEEKTKALTELVDNVNQDEYVPFTEVEENVN